MAQASPYPGFLVQDLALSGLEVDDIQAKIMGPAEKSATNTPMGVEGYVIPYYDMKGERVPFYRVKLINHDPKYKQLLDSTNHLYFPPNLPELLPNAKFILLVEGEKKACAAVKAGIPAVAASGVDSWRNRTFVIPEDAKLAQDKASRTIIRVGSGENVEERFSSVATGFFDLVNFVKHKDIPLIICYDSDFKVKALTKYEVQRAAASLGYELRARGLRHDQVRQLILDPTSKLGKDRSLWSKEFPDNKIGLDDWLLHEQLGQSALRELLYQNLAARQAFPMHPDPKQYVQKKLQRARMSRDEMHHLGLAILSDLDAKGWRLFNKNTESMYYFDEHKHKLYPTFFKEEIEFSQTPFGVKLYQDYSLTSGDSRVIKHLAAQFAGEPTVLEVEPERVLTVRNDSLYYQLNDGQMVKVNANVIRVVPNGTDDIMFEANRTIPVNANSLKEALVEVATKPLTNWWYEVLKDARLPNDDEDRVRKILSLLYYINPWFYKWRNTQLPVEMIVGEAGSGKSTLCELRLRILEGQAILRNAPNDIKDWAASVASAGGLHVTDNLHMMNPKLHQELSDELCRIVTAAHPIIEQRKFYTNADTLRIPVKSTFTFTAVEQPFRNKDIIQRSIIVNLDKGTSETSFDADWQDHQLARFGGRSRWLAHHFIMQQALFKLISEKWQHRYNAKFRLMNVEQLLVLTAEVFGWDSSWIPDYLTETRKVKIADTDWAMQGLLAFAPYWHKYYGDRRFSAQDIKSWAEGDEDYEKCSLLVNSRSLGRYMSSNKNIIAEITGIEPAGNYMNKMMYRASPRKSWPTE